MPLEIKLIWQKKFGLAALLYGLARYGTMIFLISSIYNYMGEFQTIQVILHEDILL